VSIVRLAYTRALGTLALAGALISSRPATSAQSVHELHIVASRFQFTPSTIQVTAGEPVRLVLSSMDTVHGFSIPKLKIDTQIPKGGNQVIVEFVAPAAGRYEIACSEFCGSGHGQMKAALVSAPVTQMSQ
jgi:heme/copper-type cytochrome/quinol oxidase subunit 2